MTYNCMTALLTGNCSANWFDRYGRKNGFTVYLLRYFLHENWGHNLHLSENEYLALVAVAFSRRNEVEYQRLVIRPTVRCVTIGNWFQVRLFMSIGWLVMLLIILVHMIFMTCGCSKRYLTISVNPTCR